MQSTMTAPSARHWLVALLQAVLLALLLTSSVRASGESFIRFFYHGDSQHIGRHPGIISPESAVPSVQFLTFVPSEAK